MKRAMVALGLVVFLAVGCAKKGADASAGYPVNDSVVDVSAPTYQSQPMNSQPVVYDAMTTTPQTDMGMAPAGGAYTIKKGDTLYSIARARYGDGKQWTRIADANPGLTPERLRVGQSINIP